MDNVSLMRKLRKDEVRKKKQTRNVASQIDVWYKECLDGFTQTSNFIVIHVNDNGLVYMISRLINLGITGQQYQSYGLAMKEITRQIVGEKYRLITIRNINGLEQAIDHGFAVMTPYPKSDRRLAADSIANLVRSTKYTAGLPMDEYPRDFGSGYVIVFADDGLFGSVRVYSATNILIRVNIGAVTSGTVTSIDDAIEVLTEMLINQNMDVASRMLKDRAKKW